MFEKQHRLKRDTDFKYVYKKGESIFDSACGLKFEKNDLKISRFAVVVGTKVSKSAVKRNNLRRQYREIIKARIEDLPDGYDMVFLVGKDAIGLEFSEKEHKLIQVFKKAKLL